MVVQDREKKSLELFLGYRDYKIVDLSKVIGIGGEGIVIEKKIEIQVMQGTAENFSTKKAENIRLKSKEKIITAMKFVQFESDNEENFQGSGFKQKLENH